LSLGLDYKRNKKEKGEVVMSEKFEIGFGWFSFKVWEKVIKEKTKHSSKSLKVSFTFFFTLRFLIKSLLENGTFINS